MSIYIDDEFRCHVTPGIGLREYSIDALEGKCKCYVEGHRYVPAGEVWTRADGEQFPGEMMSLCGVWGEMLAAQRAYEDGVESADGTIAALIDELEALCNEIIGG